MEKRTNKYQLILRLLQLASGESVPDKQLELTFENHDEVFDIIERIQKKNLLIPSSKPLN